MSVGFFDRISLFFSSKTGLYLYGKRKGEIGVYISYPLANNFDLPVGTVSERSLAEFLSVSTGGVNGRNIRRGEDLLFKKADGSYTTVTYQPIDTDRRGYVREKKAKTTNECLPLSALPNFERLSVAARFRAGDVFLVVNIHTKTDISYKTEYAVIAEFFDALRKDLKSPSVIWIGDKNYVIMISPDEEKLFFELAKRGVELDGEFFELALSCALIPADKTTSDQTAKLAFCAVKLGHGVVRGKYIFNESEFFEYRKYKKGEALKNEIRGLELAFTPVLSVNSGRVKYFYAEPKDACLAEKALLGGEGEYFDRVLTDKLAEKISEGVQPKHGYCVRLTGGKADAPRLKRLSEIAESEMYVQINGRIKDSESRLASLVKEYKAAGVKTVIYDPELDAAELKKLRKIGFDALRLAEFDRETAKLCADFCRMFRMECLVDGIDSEESFIEARRLGVDLCMGVLFTEASDMPSKLRYPVPVILCDEEPKKEEREGFKISLSRIAAGGIWGLFGGKAVRYYESKLAEMPHEKAEPAEKETAACEPLEYEEGLGAKKNRKEAKSDLAQKRRQKKEIKQGKLKKTKKLKNGKVKK